MWWICTHGYRGAASGALSGEAREGQKRIGGCSSWHGRHRAERFNQWSQQRSWQRGDAGSILLVVDEDSLVKDFYSRDANYAHITTPIDCSVLLQPIKDMVAHRSFDKYCTTRDGNRAKTLKPVQVG